MIKIKAREQAAGGAHVPPPVSARCRVSAFQATRRAACCGVLIAAVLVTGCAGGHPAARHPAPDQAAPASAPSASLVRVPHPDYADPASVASAFYIAWASVDAIHDGPDAYAARCAPLATLSLERQLAASQPATAAWQAMRTQPAGQPRPGARRHPPGRCPGPHLVGHVPARLRHPGHRHHGRAHDGQRRHHAPADPLRRALAGQRRPVLLAGEPAVIKVIAAAGSAAVLMPLLIILLVTAGPAPTAAKAPAPTGLSGTATALARQNIPPDYLIWYMDAARTCPGLPWSVLAGIGTVESGNGQSTATGVHSGANFAGAEGPMQFEPATFAEYAAGPDQPLSPYDPADAIYAAAAMLCASGARGGSASGIEQAVFAYNHAQWYVSEVMSWAAKYAAQGSSTVVATAIAFAKAQIGKPYQWGAAGPDAYDCSGLVYAAYADAGIHVARTTYQWQQDGPVIPLSQIQPGDLLFSAGSDGTPANPGHVVMYLGGGQVIQAPQTGQDVQIDPVDLASVVVATRPVALATKP